MTPNIYQGCEIVMPQTLSIVLFTWLTADLIKGKKLTNVRAAGSDDGLKIAPKIKFSLEECLEYIKSDDYLEVTPQSLRMRKIEFR